MYLCIFQILSGYYPDITLFRNFLAEQFNPIAGKKSSLLFIYVILWHITSTTYRTRVLIGHVG